MKISSLKTYILFSVALVVLALLATFAISLYRFQQEQLTSMSIGKIHSLEVLFAEQLHNDANMMEATLDVLILDKDIKSALRAKDRDALLKLTQGFFSDLNLKHGITHLYFTGPDRVNILRVHMPERYGDEIKRFTTLAAEKNGADSSGIELGPLGTMTLRAVKPWYDGGQLIGYVELGEEINHIIRKARDILGLEVYITIQKQFLDRQDWEAGMRMQGREPEWDRFAEVVLTDQTLTELPDYLVGQSSATKYPKKMLKEDVSVNGLDYRFGSVPLNDVSGRTVGVMTAMTDISSQKSSFAKSFVIIMAISLLACLAMFFLLFVFLNMMILQIAKTHRELWLSEERSKTLVEQSPISIQILAPDGVTVQVNRAWEKLWGVRLEDLKGYNTLQDKQLEQLGFMPYLRKAFSGETTLVPAAQYDAQKTLGKGKGTVRWVQAIMYPIKDDNDFIRNVVLMHEDITERKLFEDALREAYSELEQRLEEQKRSASALQESQSLIETIFKNSIPMCITGIDYELLHANDAYHAVFGKGQDGGTACYESRLGVLCHTEQCPMRQILQGKEIVSIDSVKADHKGNDRHYIITARPFKNANGELCGIVESFQDITERKLAEQEKEIMEAQFIQSQKMESIGRLASGVAHDFNNTLTSIIGFSELSLLKLPENDPLVEYLNIIKNSGEKAKQLTRQLLAFSRKQLLEKKPVDLNKTINDMQMVLSRMIGEDISLEIKTDISAKKVLVDPGQLDQILMNLVVNARDAMPSGGCLLIETAAMELDDNFVTRHGGSTSGSYVMLAITDTGCGIPLELQDKIFEPFFTTKEKDKGTGLGLATVYGLVKQHDGMIYMYSKINEGTTFKIYLPVAESSTEEKVKDEKSIQLSRGTETLLIVEDDKYIRQLVTDTLLSLGYKLLVVTNAEEALNISDSHKGEIDLLLTDVIMPGLNGKELADRITAKRPDIKVVFMSGYTDETITRHGILEPGCAFISKPLTLKELSSKLRTVLDN